MYFRSVANDPALVGADPRTLMTTSREYMHGLGLFNSTISSSTWLALSFGCSVKYRSDLDSGGNKFAPLLHWRPPGMQRLHDVICCRASVRGCGQLLVMLYVHLICKNSSAMAIFCRSLQSTKVPSIFSASHSIVNGTSLHPTESEMISGVVGAALGLDEGSSEAVTVGEDVGAKVGLGVGTTDGMLLGRELKVIVGPAEGVALGAELCSSVGLPEGVDDGLPLLVTVGDELGDDSGEADGSEDAVTDGEEEAMTDG